MQRTFIKNISHQDDIFCFCGLSKELIICLLSNTIIPFNNKIYCQDMIDMIPLCPILRPNLKQFQNFEEFVNAAQEKYGKQYGMVKIVPPKGWCSRSKDYHSILKGIRVEKPEHQTLYGTLNNNHYFQCQNGKSQETITIDAFRKTAKEKAKCIQHLKTPEEKEQYFWKNIKCINKQLYCANIETSLMDKSSGNWELEHLTSMFSHAIKEKLNGLNTSFLFVGAWRTFFNWHIEDLDLSAINILHEGQPKMWYAVHPQDKKLFQRIIKDIFPEKALQCPNFLRHKSTFVNPYKLKEKFPNLRISKMYQRPNEISLAFSEAYHCGFNMGFNIAEAVNYGTNNWLQKLGKFRGCKCEQKVGISIESFEEVRTNLMKSPVYRMIKGTPAFQKIEEMAAIQRKQDQQYQNLPKEEIYAQFLKEKTKKINKGLKEIYVPRFKRYFDSTYAKEKEVIQMCIQCDKCDKWLKVKNDIIKKYEKKSFFCRFVGKKCVEKKGLRKFVKKVVKKVVKKAEKTKKRI